MHYRDINYPSNDGETPSKTGRGDHIAIVTVKCNKSCINTCKKIQPGKKDKKSETYFCKHMDTNDCPQACIDKLSKIVDDMHNKSK